jgi:hypothetical protein
MRLEDKIFAVLTEAVKKIELFQYTLKESFSFDGKNISYKGIKVRINSINPPTPESFGNFEGVKLKNGEKIQIPFLSVGDVLFICKFADKIELNNLTKGKYLVEKVGGDYYTFHSKEEAELFAFERSMIENGGGYHIVKV